MITICVNSLRHICNISNDKYKWIRVGTIYNQIMNVPLFHIIYISNGDICGTNHEIMTKYLSQISPTIAYELYSTTNRWMYGYKEYVHLTHIWINSNATTHVMTGKEWTYINWIVHRLFRFQNLPMRKHCGFIIYKIVDYYDITKL